MRSKPRYCAGYLQGFCGHGVLKMLFLCLPRPLSRKCGIRKPIFACQGLFTLFLNDALRVKSSLAKAAAAMRRLARLATQAMAF